MNRITLFKRACEALWGPQYRSEGARHLNVSLRTMMRYDAGDSPIPEEIVRTLVTMLNDRMDEIDNLLKMRVR